MLPDVDLHDGRYGHLGVDPQVAVRRETCDENLGQSSWRRSRFVYQAPKPGARAG